jgi:hypothetical protein
MKKLLILISFAIPLSAFAASANAVPGPTNAALAGKKPVPVVKQLEAACLAKMTPGLGRTRVVDIVASQGAREKDVRFGLVDGKGNKSARLCQVQANGSLKITEVAAK